MKIDSCYPIVLLVLFLAGCQQQAANVTAPPAPPAPVVETAPEPEPEPETVTSSEAPKEFLIDVRSQEEWDSGHLNQAVHIPHTEITDRIAEVTDNKDAKLVLY